MESLIDEWDEILTKLYESNYCMYNIPGKDALLNTSVE